MKVYCETITGIRHAIDYDPNNINTDLVSYINEQLKQKGVSPDDLPSIIISSTSFIERKTAVPMSANPQPVENPPIPEPSTKYEILPEKTDCSLVKQMQWDNPYLYVNPKGLPSPYSIFLGWVQFKEVQDELRKPHRVSGFPVEYKCNPVLPDTKDLKIAYSRRWKKMFQITLDSKTSYKEEHSFTCGWSRSNVIEICPSLGLDVKGFTANISGKFSHEFSQYEERTISKEYAFESPDIGKCRSNVVWQLIDVIQSIPCSKLGHDSKNEGFIEAHALGKSQRKTPYIWGFYSECPLDEYAIRSKSFPDTD